MGRKMKRPKLNQVNLDEAMAAFLNRSICRVATMAPGQWDALLDETYQSGWLLLEIRNEKPVAAYQRQQS